MALESKLMKLSQTPMQYLKPKNINNSNYVKEHVLRVYPNPPANLINANKKTANTRRPVSRMQKYKNPICERVQVVHGRSSQPGLIITTKQKKIRKGISLTQILSSSNISEFQQLLAQRKMQAISKLLRAADQLNQRVSVDLQKLQLIRERALKAGVTGPQLAQYRHFYKVYGISSKSIGQLQLVELVKFQSHMEHLLRFLLSQDTLYQQGHTGPKMNAKPTFKKRVNFARHTSPPRLY